MGIILASCVDISRPENTLRSAPYMFCLNSAVVTYELGAGGHGGDAGGGGGGGGGGGRRIRPAHAALLGLGRPSSL